MAATVSDPTRIAEQCPQSHERRSTSLTHIKKWTPKQLGCPLLSCGYCPSSVNIAVAHFGNIPHESFAEVFDNERFLVGLLCEVRTTLAHALALQHNTNDLIFMMQIYGLYRYKSSVLRKKFFPNEPIGRRTRVKAQPPIPMGSTSDHDPEQRAAESDGQASSHRSKEVGRSKWDRLRRQA